MGHEARENEKIEVCKNCFNYSALMELDKEGSATGECRCNPPQVVMMQGPRGQMLKASEFPPVISRGWCGQFKMKSTFTL